MKRSMKRKMAVISAAICIGCGLGIFHENIAYADNSTGDTEAENYENTNPCEEAFMNEDQKAMLSRLKRVDEDGYLYELEYTCDYYDAAVTDLLTSVIQVGAGCSAFTTYNTDNDYVMARNYDYMHPDAEGNPTGQNLVLITKPEGKLKSVSVCDTFWLNQNAYFNGTLDDGKTDVSCIVLTPYVCVDGVNEAGVSAAILALDTKPGETPTNQNTGKEKTTCSVLLRYILDEAKNINEAVEIAKKYDMYSTSNQDLHIIIADKDGNSAVLEWRQYQEDTAQKLYVTYTNVVTNFLVGFDDAEDMYYQDGSLRERFSAVTNTVNEYHYGYGHGYHRFSGIVSAMDRYIEKNAEKNDHGVINSKMTDQQALNILSQAAQEPGTENTSMTQYSALFDMTNGNVTICAERDYSRTYEFTW